MGSISKKCVGLIFGGKSNEHFVSINSAQAIFRALKSKQNKIKCDFSFDFCH